MEFRTRLHETTLTARQRPRDEVYRIDREHGYIVLVLSMEVRQVMWPADLGEHSNDNSVEAAQFWNGRIILP